MTYCFFFGRHEKEKAKPGDYYFSNLCKLTQGYYHGIVELTLS